MSDKRCVLLAEDELMLRLLVEETLEEAGFDVLPAGDGVEALELLTANSRISLLVSDIKMPRMDGYSLVEASLAFRPDLKVLLMTGYAQTPPPLTLQARDIAVLHKPFDLDRLCELATEMTK